MAECQKAFETNPEAKFAWTCHHAILVESLWEKPLERINYISKYKLSCEMAMRFRNFRPVRVTLPAELVELAMTLGNAADQPWSSIGQRQYDEALTNLNNYIKANAELINQLHDQDWPNNSWNGEEIFAVFSEKGFACLF